MAKKSASKQSVEKATPASSSPKRPATKAKPTSDSPLPTSTDADVLVTSTQGPDAWSETHMPRGSTATAGNTRKHRLKAIVSEWKDEIAIVIAIFALAVSTVSLIINGYQQRKAAHKEAQAAAQAIFDNLRKTESRYQLTTPPVMAGSDDERFQLRVVTTLQDGKATAFFTLPWVLTYRNEKRTRSVVVNGEVREQDYTVGVPQRAPVSVGEYGAFGCVDCNSSYRLDLYLSAKRLQELSEHPTTASDHIRFARAAMDFGELEVTEIHLKEAAKAVEGGVPSVHQANIREQIGKTRLLMGDTIGGYRALAECKEFWRANKLRAQLGNLHDILNWEAQYACTVGDRLRAIICLEEMSQEVAGYKIGKARYSKMIEDAYATCLGILAAFEEFDPRMPVPREFVVHSSELGGWISPVEYCETVGLGAELPHWMAWDSATPDANLFRPDLPPAPDVEKSVLEPETVPRP
ncbi:hypothetical protein [Candidatus Laterigemmans baculatus]|uniref:hypothetical protein n=1 Tax=Candidatus Laterigemmans baculatus TaxID=2770505 RepID=UPI0013DB6450|nr:hypothetical protein [Candidatus Laterigemmans baculatus]